jgi:hypothetical protein
VLKRLLNHPLTELGVGLMLVLSGTLELGDVMLVKLPNRGPLLPHALLLLGAGLVLRSLPAIFIGLDFIRQALPAAMHNTFSVTLNRLTHCHAVGLTMGLILIVSGLADIADTIIQGGGFFLFSSASGAVAFGLAPAINALIALYKGLRCVDRAHSFSLLDRAVQNPWVQGLAGLFMLCGGMAEIWAATTGRAAMGYGVKLSRAMAILGLFGLLMALPGIYLGLRNLSSASERDS